MADSWTRNVTCRYFKNGMCREGVNCRYRHVQASRNDVNLIDVETVSSTIPCRFFKQGNCRFGNQCRFNHSSPNQSSITTETLSEPHTSNNSVLSNEILSTVSKQNNSDMHPAEEWVLAPEFVPSVIATSSLITEEYTETPEDANLAPISYAQAVNANAGQTSHSPADPLCPYAEANGICRKLNCPYLHGDLCDLCGAAALHPYNEEHRKKHINACVKQHEMDMEISFAIQRSREKSCGVCFETIMEKSTGEQRFGILPNCNHCFCLSCIRKWRQAKQFDNKIIRACPECRVPSDFVCPSIYWVDTKEEKDKLIMDYKDAMGTKDCKYFNKGRGKCPFGNKCFYLHALPDGTKTDVGPPARNNRGTNELGFRMFRLLSYWMDRDVYGINHVDDFDLLHIVSLSDEDSSDTSSERDWEISGEC